MSIYYNYYVGYIKDKKLYPLGPFNAFGKLKTVVGECGSFASPLKDEFTRIGKEQLTDELLKAISSDLFDQSREKIEEYALGYVEYLPVKDLPSGSFVKEGYFLISEVEQYLRADENGRWELLMDEIFYDRISRETYAARLQNELTLGKDPEEHSCRDYMYFAYPAYDSMEYKADLLRTAATQLSEFEDSKYDELIIILEIS